MFRMTNEERANRKKALYEKALHSDKMYISPADASTLLECNQQSLRTQARRDPSVMGYPVFVVERRVKIPRKPFLEFYQKYFL